MDLNLSNDIAEQQPEQQEVFQTTLHSNQGVELIFSPNHQFLPELIFKT